MIYYPKHLQQFAKLQNELLVRDTMTFKLWVARRFTREMLQKCEPVKERL
jgi:hypothetical protein